MATPIPGNTCCFTAAEIIKATGATLTGSVSKVGSISIDSRTIIPGALFVALRGVRDGHDFLAAASAHAAAALVERGRGDGVLPCFETTDTLAALGALARFHLERERAARAIPVVTIGGAAGKTTTKELTAAMLRALYDDIAATPGNLNNLIGVPMTILTLAPVHRAAVLECGTNRAGEIAQLAAMVKPDVALVLNVDIEHTEGLGSLQGVADEETAIFRHARTAVIDTAEAMVAARVPTGIRTVTFGDASPADVRLHRREIIERGGQRVTLALNPRLVEDGVKPQFDAILNLVGAAAAHNA
ncbi:MAG: Mur ligase family protein, partial [Candidatus Binataceae bacterium]